MKKLSLLAAGLSIVFIAAAPNVYAQAADPTNPPKASHPHSKGHIKGSKHHKKSHHHKHKAKSKPQTAARTPE